MGGAIAGGHPLTAEAGARILAAGGNAVDACVAAAFTSWVAESPLTGPGAGGFMLVHRARTGFQLTRPQAYLHAILDVILRHTDEGRAVYSRNGARLQAGDRLSLPDLATTLERIAERGAADLYRGEFARGIVRSSDEL